VLFFLRRRMKNHIRPAMIARPTTPPTTPPAIAPVLDEEDPEELPDSLLEDPPVPLAVVVTVTVPPAPADDPVDVVFVVTALGIDEVVEGVVVVVIPLVVAADVVVVGALYVRARSSLKPLEPQQPRLVYLNTQLVDTTGSRRDSLKQGELTPISVNDHVTQYGSEDCSL
jgi:hypothetical protein